MFVIDGEYYWIAAPFSAVVTAAPPSLAASARFESSF
jgi:hypothetical protein